MRDPYRDNDDARDPLERDERTVTKSDTKSEARGDARVNVGNHARNTASGTERVDGTRKRDEFDTTRDR